MQMVRALGLAAALLAAGCSSGGDSNPVINPNGGNIPPGPGSTQFRLQAPGFTAGQVATAVLRHTPPSENAPDATLTAQSARELAVDVVDPREGDPAQPDIRLRDMPVLLQQIEAAQRKPGLGSGLPGEQRRAIPVVGGAAATQNGFPGELRRYQQLGKGQDTTFFVSTSGQTVTARKLNDESETVHCTIFAQVVNGTPVVSEARALQIANAFDVNNPFMPGAGIYDQVRGIVGTEWTNNGGRDGDPKINIVLLSDQGIGGEQFFGFFRPNDEYPKSQVADSNEAEIVFLNGTDAVGDMFDLLGSLAHEFSHMVTFNMKFGRQGAFNGQFENNAIDEGRAVMVEDLLGYGLVPQVGAQGSGFVFRVAEAFLENPDARGLFQFSGSADAYGRPYSLHRYLVDRFGLDQWRAYNQSGGVGLAQLNASYGPFDATFADWTLALVADPLAGPVPPQHRFTGPFHPRGTYNIRGMGSSQLPGVVPARTFNTPAASLSANLPAWAFTTFEYTGGTGAALNVDVTAPANVNGNILVEAPRGTFNAIR